MAEVVEKPTLLSDTVTWLATQKDTIIDVAKRFGVSPTAVAWHIGEEYDQVRADVKAKAKDRAGDIILAAQLAMPWLDGKSSSPGERIYNDYLELKAKAIDGRIRGHVPITPLDVQNKKRTMEGPMARTARVVVPGWPHHVTQRGNRRQQTFFRDGDYAFYLQLMAEFFPKAGVEVWGYCLMPNHVHIVAAPATKESLSAAVGETNRRYTWAINRREKWTGYLWQGRFASFPMDSDYFVTCSRYVGLNPVRANLAARAQDWAWSSVNAHRRGADDAVVKTAPLLARVTDVERFFAADVPAEARRKLRMASVTGRPLGASQWVKALEAQTGRTLAPGRPGRKPLACAA